MSKKVFIENGSEYIQKLIADAIDNGILQRVGENVGFINPEIVLWQMKNSTSHKYKLRENILILQKPY